MPQTLIKKEQNNDKLNSCTFRFDTPQGTAWIQIFDKDIGKIERVILSVGKAGSDINALCAGLSEMVTELICKGNSISFIINCLSGITSDKLVKIKGQKVHTPLDALVLALIKYRSIIPNDLEEESLGRHLSRVR